MFHQDAPRTSRNVDARIPQLASRTLDRIAYSDAISASIGWEPQNDNVMPLISFLKAGYEEGKEPGWHRALERAARGHSPVQVESPLESWELEMLLIEILIITGNSQEIFRYLAHAWGQRDGFHRAIGRNISGRSCNEVSDQESELGDTSQDPHEQESISYEQGSVCSQSIASTRLHPGATVASSPNASSLQHDFRRDQDKQKNTSGGGGRSLETLITLLSYAE